MLMFGASPRPQAEVQSVGGDGGVALHTRSTKYGALVGGLLVVVPPGLVKRQKAHFHTLAGLGEHISKSKCEV